MAKFIGTHVAIECFRAIGINLGDIVFYNGYYYRFMLVLADLVLSRIFKPEDITKMEHINVLDLKLNDLANIEFFKRG